MQRILIISIVIYLLILSALITLNGDLLAFALPFVIYFSAGLLFKPEKVKLRVNRTLSTDRVTPSMPVVVEVSIRNLGSGLENAFFFDALPPNIEIVEGNENILTSLDPGETSTLEYTIRGKRGYYNFSGINLVVSDSLGIFKHKQTIPAEGKLLIQPEVKRISRIAIRPRGTRVYSGFIPARQGGPGVEFFGVRQYQQGDPLRWINWKASARHHQAYFINEFEQERVADVGLILDTRRRSEVKLAEGESLFEHCILATAALSETFLNDGNRVGLLLYGTHLDWTIPGYGKIQRERILQSLARAEPGDSLIFGTLDHLPTRLFPPNSQLVIISPLQKDDQEMLIRLRGRGYALLVISPDPVSFEIKYTQMDTTLELAARIARLERTLMLHKLRQAGIQVLDWDVETNLDATLHVALSPVIPQIHAKNL
ncbi:MAG: DUF58 domain-containing protein [Anaerolineales bacterium]|jgi:uncharacterized protein (DUF58 family)